MTKKVYLGEQFLQLFPRMKVTGGKPKNYDAVLLVELNGKKFAYNIGNNNNTVSIINQMGVVANGN